MPHGVDELASTMPDTITPVPKPELVPQVDPASVPATQVSRLSRFLHKCFSFRVLLGAILVSGVFFVERSIRLGPDTWWHLRVGTDILATHHFPVVDHYSFTARGVEWFSYEWLGNVVMAMAARAGLGGMDLLLMAVSSLIVVLIYYYAWLRCKECKAAFLATVIVGPLAMLSMTLRPQLLGYTFLLITLICLERFRQGHRNALWVLPPVFLLWVNTHGSFVLGFMAMGLYWASGLSDFSWGGIKAQRWSLGERIRLELAALVSVLMLPITPYGTRLATVPVEYAFALAVPKADVQEWQPLNFNFWQAKLLVILVLAFIVAQIAFRLSYRLEELALFFVISYSAFVHFRFAIVFAIVFAPLAAVILARWTPPYDPRIDKYALNALLILVAVISWVWYFPSQADMERKVETEFPVQAVRYLRQHPIPEPMFNEYVFGGYLVWSREPTNGVFIDGRADLYEHAGVFQDYGSIIDVTHNAPRLFGRYNIQSFLVKRGCPLATFLAATSKWEQVYQDDLSVLYVRKDISSEANQDRKAAQTLTKGLD